MVAAPDFTVELEAKVAQQLKSQRVGYLLGAVSSYLNECGHLQQRIGKSILVKQNVANGHSGYSTYAEILAR